MKMFVALLAAFLFACLDSCASLRVGDDNSPNQSMRNSCTGASFYLTLPELTRIAKGEFEKRGGRYDEKWKVSARTENCNYLVYVVQVPARPGGFFLVTISAVSGKVIEYDGGT